MKKILSLLLVITLLFTLGGCFNSNEDNITHEDVKNRVIDEATEYLKKTYPDDEFTYISGRSPNWAYPYYEIGFSSKNYDNQLVTVYGDPDDEANTEDGLTVYNYYDDYYQYYMLEDAEEYFYDIAKEYFGDDIIVKISFDTGIGSAKKVINSMDFEDYRNKDIGLLKIYFFHYHNKKLQNLEDFVDILKMKCGGMYCEFAKIKNGKEEYIKTNSLKEITYNALDNYETEESYVFDHNGNIM